MIPSRSVASSWQRIATALGVAFSIAPSAAAITIPLATFQESLAVNLQGESVPDPDPSVPNAVSYSKLVTNGNGSAQLDGSATSVGGNAPTLTASATADGGASFQIDAVVDVQYYFAVSGPASVTPIPIRITYAGTGTAAGPVADGLATIDVDRLSPATNLLHDILGISSVFGPSTDSFGDTVFASADVDSIHSVRLQAEARAQAAGGVSQADVSVDPLIEVDPTFVNAGLYAITYSANIGVPEPDPSWLGAAALTTVALRRARKRVRSSAASRRSGLQPAGIESAAGHGSLR